MSPESSVCLIMAVSCLLLESTEEINLVAGVPGTWEVKPCNLPMKESAMTSETHWPKPPLPLRPSPINLPCPLHAHTLQPCSFGRASPQILISFLMTRCLGTGVNSVITKRSFRRTTQHLLTLEGRGNHFLLLQNVVPLRIFKRLNI